MAQATLAKEQTFQWEGKDQKGTRVKGESAGTSPAIIKAMLRKQGITPVSVRKKSALFGGKRKKRIKPGDIAVFSRQMATMMASGVPLVQSLELIAKGNENPSMRDLINTIRDDIRGGSTLTEALAKHPRYFDELFVNLVDAGERSGALETVLAKIAGYKEKTEAIKGKVKKAMYYPSAVICVAFIVMGILLYFVVPEFQSLFQGFGASLPAFTLLIIHLSDIVQHAWWMLLLAIGAGVWAFAQAHRRSRKFRRLVDRLLLQVPIIGDILDKAAVARFSRTLATMFAAGVPLVEALDSVGRAAGNIIYEEAILQMRDQVSTGQTVALTMQQTALFPSMAVQMVAIGEEAGALDSMCSKVADFYEEQVDNKVDSLSSLMEPMIMVVIGIMVGSLVIAMYLPIFKLGSVV